MAESLKTAVRALFAGTASQPQPGDPFCAGKLYGLWRVCAFHPLKFVELRPATRPTKALHSAFVIYFGTG